MTTHHVTHCVTYTLKDCTAISIPKWQAGVDVKTVMMQAKKLVIKGVQLDVPKCKTNIYFIKHATLPKALT